MKLTTLLPVSALALSLSAFAPPTDAKPTFVQRIPNGANVPGVEALGHIDGTGGSGNNAFGKAFNAAGQKWTTALCKADTDGDGQTNGQELGDPCCEWSEGGTPRYATATHPSDATKTNNASLWSSITCPATSTTSSSNLPTVTMTLAVAIAAIVTITALHGFQ